VPQFHLKATVRGIRLDTKGPGFTVFNGDVLFAGDDASGDNGLWVRHVGRDVGADRHRRRVYGPTGLDPLFLTVFNGEVLFQGRDTSGNYCLWVTNGTAAGTSEIGVGGIFTGMRPRLEAPTRLSAWSGPAISTALARRTSYSATIGPATPGSRR
jgi:hypothetical protein